MHIVITVRCMYRIYIKEKKFINFSMSYYIIVSDTLVLILSKSKFPRIKSLNRSENLFLFLFFKMAVHSIM